MRCIKNIKFLLATEKYLTVDMSFYLQKALARFRCSSHKLRIEFGCHLNIDREHRVCVCCVNNADTFLVEDEFHVFFHCLRFRLEREKYLYSWYTGRNIIGDFFNLLKSESSTVIKK